MQKKEIFMKNKTKRAKKIISPIKLGNPTLIVIFAI